MWTPAVVLKWRETGVIRRCHPGQIIGRMPNAAFPIPRASVSEAHALVSLRRNAGTGDVAVALLALRGRLTVSGAAHTEAPVFLHAGLVVELCSGVSLEVVEVETATQVLALVTDDRVFPLIHDACTFVVDAAGQVVLREGLSREGLLVWIAGGHICAGWGGDTIELEPGTELMVGGRRAWIDTAPVPAASGTEVAAGAPRGGVVLQVDLDHTLLTDGRAADLRVVRRGHDLISAFLACIAGMPAEKVPVGEVYSCEDRRVPYEDVAKLLQVTPENLRCNILYEFRKTLVEHGHRKDVLLDYGKSGGCTIGHGSGVVFTRVQAGDAGAG